MTQQNIIIANHRTGSSMLAGILHKLGCPMFLDPNNALMGAPGNEHGHYEDLDFVHLNDKIIQDWQTPATRDEWDRELLKGFTGMIRARNEEFPIMWGAKDPRFCFTALELLVHLERDEDRPLVIAMEREDNASIQSLIDRDGHKESAAKRIFWAYENARHLAMQTTTARCVKFHFEYFYSDPKGAVDMVIQEVWKNEDLPRPDKNQVARAVRHIKVPE